MARKPRATASAKKAEAASTPFLEALKFISIVTKETGSVNETHVALHNRCAVAFNGVLAAGVRLTEDLYACPHTTLLIKALSKCGENLSVTQLDNNRLSIKSGKFKAVVPCVDPSLLSMAAPDPQMSAIDDSFKHSLSVCNLIDIEESQDLISNSILMNGGSLVSSNRKVIIEHWHGFDMPSGLLLPKIICQSINKCSKKLVAFGCSNSSATFWFEDDSWIRTQLIVGNWPNLNGILDGPSNPWSTPADLFPALKAVEPFSEEGLVYFDAGLLRTHPVEGAGASYEVHGLPKGPVFSIKQLLMLETIAQKIDFMAPGPHDGMKALKFFGERVRGCIAGRSEPSASGKAPEPLRARSPMGSHLDDDIPF